MEKEGRREGEKEGREGGKKGMKGGRTCFEEKAKWGKCFHDIEEEQMSCARVRGI